MEFIRILLNELVQDNIKTKPSSNYHNIDNDNKTKREVFDEYNKFMKTREQSYIHDIFYFQTITTYTCFWVYKSYTCENLLEIPLLILEENEKFNLNELLENYFKIDEVTWEYKCWNCKKEKKTYKINPNMRC